MPPLQRFVNAETSIRLAVHRLLRCGERNAGQTLTERAETAHIVTNP